MVQSVKTYTGRETQMICRDTINKPAAPFSGSFHDYYIASICVYSVLCERKMDCLSLEDEDEDGDDRDKQ